MHRHGYTEECYFNFTFSPIRGENGAVEGIFNAVVETTFRVIEERRERTLRGLAEQLAAARSESDVITAAFASLQSKPEDLPFCLLYALDDDSRAGLEGRSGLADPAVFAPSDFDASAGTHSGWPLITANSQNSLVVDLLEQFHQGAQGAVWPEEVTQALIARIDSASGGESRRYLVVGINPRRALDDDYRAFIERVAMQIGTALTNVRAFEAERRRAEALSEIDKAKTAFFSNVSHEFRTPLTLMLGPLEEAVADERENSQDRERLEIIRRNALRLLKLVNSLLDFSRIEAGRAQANVEPTDLAALTKDLASTFRSAIERAGLDYVVDCPPLPELVNVDRDMWEKIVLNLLSNAFKFTFAGQIKVQLGERDGAAVLTISDTGTGIPANEIGKLFERFHRVEGARGRSIEGTGIGLALVQELARFHGGEIRAESVEGEGSRFEVTIPAGALRPSKENLRDDRSASLPAGVRADAFVQEALQWLPAEASTAPSPLPLTFVPGAARILLADDNADMQAYVQRLLAGTYNVEVVGDGLAALEAIRAHKPDLLLTDVMMPKLDGFGLIQAVRGDTALQDLPIIVLSARAGEEARADGLDAGADDYLIKPFAARELVASVQSNLDLARLRRETTASLRESEARFRNMADHAPVMMWVTDENGLCTYLNRGWYEFTGQKQAEGLGGGWLEVVHPEDNEAALQTLLAANSDRTPFRFEYRLRRADGVFRWAINAGAPRFGQGGEFLGYVGSVIDITERRESEALQAADAKRLEALNRTGAALATGLDLERLVQTATDAGVELTGAQFGAFFYNVIGEAGESYMLYTLSGVPRSAFENFPMPRNTKIFAPTFTGEGVVRSDDITMDARYGYSEPYRGMPKGHLPVKSYLAVPVASNSGEVIGGLFFGHAEPGQFTAAHEALVSGIAGQAAVALDNARLYQTAQREVEQRRKAEDELSTLNAQLEQRVAEAIDQRAAAEQALRQAQKMESLGQLTGGVAHDFNNLLQVIGGNLQLLVKDIAGNDKAGRRVTNALAGVERGAKLASQLLAFGRRQPLEPKVVNIGRFVVDIEEMLRRTIGEGIQIETIRSGGLWNVSVDPVQVENAILNLAITHGTQWTDTANSRSKWEMRFWMMRTPDSMRRCRPGST